MKTQIIFGSILRTLIFTLALTLVLTRNSFSQTHKYIPFPDSNAVWVQKLLDEFGQFKQGWQYFIENDTIINSKTYHKILSSDDSLLMNRSQIWYGLRNDTAARKVFMFDNGSNQEWLLYDFSLNEGDTISLSWGGTGRYYLSVITNIDTLLLNGKDHLVYYTSYGLEARAPYIEGIGSVSGLFEDTDFFEGGTELVCLMTGEDRMPYFTYWPNTCELYHWTGLGDPLPAPRDEVSVFPNPLDYSSQLELKSENDMVLQISIYKLSGQAVFESQDIPSNSLSLGDILKDSGVYFYTIITRNGNSYSGKIIK